jgi:dihydroxyacid dehydratase/phosphogluconate dehydratase
LVRGAGPALLRPPLAEPVIGIINTWSDINPCHAHFRDRAEEVKRGVWQAGGFPAEMPAMSLSEPFQKPSTMLYRNLLAMETEELLRSYPAFHSRRWQNLSCVHCRVL